MVTAPGQPLADFAPWDTIMVPREWKAEELNDQILAHLKSSVANYRKSVALDPANGMAFLGLGWTLEDGSGMAGKAGPSSGFGAKSPPTSDEEKKDLGKKLEALGRD